MKKILSSILIIVLVILISIPIWKQVIQEFSSNDYKTLMGKEHFSVIDDLEDSKVINK